MCYFQRVFCLFVLLVGCLDWCHLENSKLWDRPRVMSANYTGGKWLLIKQVSM